MYDISARSRMAASAYASVGLTSSTLGATPHELITLLFDGAHAAMQKALAALAAGDITARGKELGKAIEIIGRGLNGALDTERGGDLALQLSLLYDYMVRRLLYANLHADAAAIKEIDGLLGGLSAAWKRIGTEAQHEQAPI